MRDLGTSSIRVSSVALGCWPIAGVSSLDVNPQDSLATLQAALESGVNFFDTAYCYGRKGESETLIGKALGHRRDDLVLATKGGMHFGPEGDIRNDGSPETLKRECEESLRRLGTDRVDLYYLHAPDPDVPIEESAGAIRELVSAGKARAAGASNLTLQQYRDFHSTCPLAAIQPPYNMLMREIEDETVPWCTENGIGICVYWPLMKGLLAGKLPRDHHFDPRDGRAKYPMFQGEEYQRNIDLVDQLRKIAQRSGHTVAQLAVAWTLHQKGITAALCGAKRAWQIEETAVAMSWHLSGDILREVETALRHRGRAVTRSAV